VRRGRLRGPGTGPRTGERVEPLVELDGLRVEHISSGELAGPVDYRQDEDEWVVLLAGAATLELRGERLELTPGDWLFLPAGVPHRLLATAAGSSWLAVYSG
jgi:cupin 2 domain-containing protein